MPQKIAFITGGASGIGLSVAKALSSHPTVSWEIHIADLNAEAGKQALSELMNAHFHQVNVTDYASLSRAFEAAYNASQRLDFVFANAGVVEKDNFYAQHDVQGPPPPPPNQLSVDINYKAVVDTSYLALHYFRKAKSRRENSELDPVLVMTASCGALYPSEFCPMYSGSKAAVMHFNRAIAVAYHHEGIRTLSICPGMIRTGLMTQEEWSFFQPEQFTPVESVRDTVVKLVDGGDLKDAKGVSKSRSEMWGLTVEINGQNFYFREAPEFCDDNMRTMMAHTSMTTQLARIEAAQKGASKL
ncbi:hypothetical protein ACJQWK_08637 [Exserohilum turcicum]